MAKLPAETIALTQAVQAILAWGEGAFATASPLALHPRDAGGLSCGPRSRR